MILVIATSARFRNKNIKHINLEDLKKLDFKKKLVFYLDQRHQVYQIMKLVMLIILYKYLLILIFKSLNLSHSLIIIAQYVASIIKLKIPFKNQKKLNQQVKKKYTINVNLCIKNLDEINFFRPKEKRQKC